MKKRHYIIIIAIIVIIAGVAALYIYIKKLNREYPKAGDAKSQSVVDVRPLIAAKLKQLVKDGSDSLYNLSIGRVVPDILGAELDLYNVTLIPDSTALMKLDSAQKAPDDIFKISLRVLHIDGITINDFMKQKELKFDSVFIKEPVIEAYHNPRPYNKAQSEKDSAATLYQKLMKQVKSISINSITVQQGTFITNDVTQKNRKRSFNYVSMHISRLLIDSTTQYDKDRFLFAKKAELSCRDYITTTPDSLYRFKIGNLSVHAQTHVMIAEDVSLTPRESKDEFEKGLTWRKDRFTMSFAKVVFRHVDWWSFTNNEYFFSNEADVDNAQISDYVDGSLPAQPKVKQDNFPSQLLMRVPLQINISKINFHQLNVEYEEYNPTSEQSSTIYFANIYGVLTNITNVPAEIKKNSKTKFSGTGLFMKQVPLTCKFQFDFSKHKTGDFSVDINLGEINKDVLNPFTQPLGMFTVKSGTMQQGNAHIEGNNFSAKCKLQMLYNDLHLTPLKKDDDGLKRKTITGLIANAFLIKNNNPSHGEAPRTEDIFIQRKESYGFFTLVWKAMLTAIVKTIGIPGKYADK
jgi:hypothetical protein